MKIVVDTNIIFSAILNTNNNINKLLQLNNITFISISYLKYEIWKHKEKIQKITKYDEITYLNIYNNIISKITFIDDILITNESYLQALELTKDIDKNDTLFVALANQLNTYLWTGDKKLYNGLVNKKYNQVISTEELNSLFKVF